MLDLAVVIITVLILSLRFFIFLYGSSRERKISGFFLKNKFQPFVSIVVPARDEERNIEKCVRSIVNNKYPKDKFEIIVVNDRSTDATGQILLKMREEIANLKTVTINDMTANTNLLGKPGALQAGIDKAQGEVVLMTDADCEVNPMWIASHASVYADKNTGLVASYTLISGSSSYDNYQSFEWIYNHTLASAGVGLGKPLGCFGNNLSVRKSAFDKIGGYENIDFSVTEDLALLDEMHKRGSKCYYVCDEKASVETQACSNVEEYLRQRHRWVVGGLNLGWRAGFFVLTTFTMWLGIIASLALGEPLWAAGLALFRLVCDFALVAAPIGKLGARRLRYFAFPAAFVLMINELIMPFLLLKRNVVWKNQVFSRRKKAYEKPIILS